jgi:hypothetical protein
MPHGQLVIVHSNNTIHSLPTVQKSLGIVTLPVFEKVYDGEPILTLCRYLKTINDFK